MPIFYFRIFDNDMLYFVMKFNNIKKSFLKFEEKLPTHDILLSKASKIRNSNHNKWSSKFFALRLEISFQSINSVDKNCKKNKTSVLSPLDWCWQAWRKSGLLLNLFFFEGLYSQKINLILPLVLMLTSECLLRVTLYLHIGIWN